MSRLAVGAFVLGVLCGLVGMGCGGGEESPGCTLASTHYYEAGCSFIDLNTGDPIPVGTWISNCRGAEAFAAGTACEDEMDDLLFCLDGVPNPSTDSQCSACNFELDRVISCQP